MKNMSFNDSGHYSGNYIRELDSPEFCTKKNCKVMSLLAGII